MARSGKRTGRASLALLAALTAAALWLGLGIRAAAAPEQPQSVAAQNCVTCIRVTWAATGGAEEYIVYRKVPGGPWAELGRTAGTVWNDRTAEDGTDYRYTVRARAGTAKSPLAPPQVGAANARSGVRVSWSEVPAAERYAVYRRTPGGAWAKLKSVKAGTDSWLDGSAAGGTRYEYAVRAVCGGSRSALGQTALVRLGAPETAVRRLNFAQMFNPVGSLAGILLAQQFILANLNPATADERAAMAPARKCEVKP